MSQHLVIAPVLVPFTAAVILLLLGDRAPLWLQRAVGAVSALTLVAVAVALLGRADTGAISVYRLGHWPAPFGIVLVLDRLAASMLLLTSVLGTVVLGWSMGGSDARGGRFHTLLQAQLMGLHGAFLTGDMFNLFVFFEILLLASYGLLLHGAGKERLRAAIHYVVLNLAGSGLFLVALGILYAALGTMNMADMAARAASVPAADAGLLRVGGLLLMTVFALKAALFPLLFWLPRTYAVAEAGVAALFAIMTKVGVYALIRVGTQLFGPEGQAVANLAWPFLFPAALGTMAFGAFGTLAATRLRHLAAHLVLSSVGLLLAVVSVGSKASLAAALYYLPHSTLLSAATFLLMSCIEKSRWAGDWIGGAAPARRGGVLAALYFIMAIATVGLPPLSGFWGKVAMLRTVAPWGPGLALWIVALVVSLLSLVALARVGSVVFWRQPVSPSEKGPPTARQKPWLLVPVALLLSASVALSVFAEPVLRFADRTARQLHQPARFSDAVLKNQKGGKL
jgi:multicomponent K+:H+ antiporter subunit D